MTKYEEAKKAYGEISEIIQKHKHLFSDKLNDIDSRIKPYLRGLELADIYKLNIEPQRISSTNYHNFNDYLFIGWYGEKYNRTISREDNGKQPEDELLLKIGFSTGAYIFGDDYPTELFKRFWEELKTYNYKYIDTANKGLYFDIDNAHTIFNKFNEILNNYREINKEDFKKRKVEKLKKEIESLEK